jgi:hypothetical protein
MRRYVMNTLRRERLVDELVEAYIDWREMCVRANDAYGAWAGETGPRGRVAFELYTVALDAEERAAEVYAGLVRRADEVPWSEDPPDEPLGGRAPGVGWQ